MNRKLFLKYGLGGVLGAAALPSWRIKEHPEPIASNLVKEFVAVGHGKIIKVKEMLEDYPNLLFCRYDWGHGDYEEAIEGAGHVGNAEIAEYLIGQGARVNIYVLTMLGKTEIVKSLLTLYPNLLNGKGAHGLSLLHHAKAGGDKSQELYDYIKSLGLSESKFSMK